MYIFPGYINIVILILHIQYIDILYNYCHWHWYWHWHWHLWVDESKTCGMVSKAWVSSTQFGSKGGEKGGEKRSGKYLQNRIHYICLSQSLRGSRHYSGAATQAAKSGKTACLSVAK